MAMMTPYNYTADMPFCKVEWESSKEGFLPISQQVREIQKDAIIEAEDEHAV